MSLVGRVGGRRPRARLAMALVYAVLSLGAATTLFPFLLMISSGLKGPRDMNDPVLVPRYLTDRGELLRKYLADKYAENPSEISANSIGAQLDRGLVAEYEEFLTQLPIDYWKPGFALPPNQVSCRLSGTYQAWLRSRYGSITAVDRAYVEEAVGFQSIEIPSELLERTTWSVPTTRKYEEWRRFKLALPAEFRIPIRMDRLYQVWATS